MWILPFLALLQFAPTEVQAANYKIQHEDLKVASYNKDYVMNPKTMLFPYNDTSLAYNLTITFKHDVPSNVRVGIRTYVFQAKAYRKFPYEFDPSVCEMFGKNEFGVRRIYDYSNFRGCPLKGNVVYYCNNFIVDDKKIPKNILIPGRFRADVKLFTKSVEYVVLQWFVSIVPDKH